MYHHTATQQLTWSERVEPRSLTIWLRTTQAPLELCPWKSKRPSNRNTTNCQRFSVAIFLQRTLERSLTREKRLFGSSFSALSLKRLTASTSWSAIPAGCTCTQHRVPVSVWWTQLTCTCMCTCTYLACKWQSSEWFECSQWMFDACRGWDQNTLEPYGQGSDLGEVSAGMVHSRLSKLGRPWEVVTNSPWHGSSLSHHLIESMAQDAKNMS